MMNESFLLLIGLFTGTFLVERVFLRSKRNQLRRICSGNSWVVSRINHLMARFSLLLFINGVTTGLYAFAPGYYSRFTLLIDPLDDPLINATGLVMLIIAFLWLFGVQLVVYKTLSWHLDKAKQAKGKHRQWLYDTWFLHSTKLVSAGIVILLIGFFVTLSSIIALILAAISLILFQILLLYTEST